MQSNEEKISRNFYVNQYILYLYICVKNIASVNKQ